MSFRINTSQSSLSNIILINGKLKFLKLFDNFVFLYIYSK